VDGTSDDGCAAFGSYSDGTNEYDGLIGVYGVKLGMYVGVNSGIQLSVESTVLTLGKCTFEVQVVVDSTVVVVVVVVVVRRTTHRARLLNSGSYDGREMILAFNACLVGSYAAVALLVAADAAVALVVVAAAAAAAAPGAWAVVDAGSLTVAAGR